MFVHKNFANVQVDCTSNNHEEKVIVPWGMRLNSNVFYIFKFMIVTQDDWLVSNYVLYLRESNKNWFKTQIWMCVLDFSCH